MIDAHVSQLAKDFSTQWSLRTDKAPVLALDFSWPSVGILDLLTYHIRGIEALDDEDRQIIKGASAYLAVMAHECWETFGERISVGEDGEGIFIKVQSGEGKELLALRIESALASLLKKPPHPFPLIGTVEREVLPDHNFLSLFGIGVMTGLSPFGEGPWSNEKVEERVKHTESAVRVLAKNTAEHFSRLYPDEQLGQVAELYLRRLIYPPAMVDEAGPAMRAVEGMLSFVGEYQVSKKGYLQLARNFALSPDELISSAGLAFYGAVMEGLPFPEIMPVAQTLGTYVGVLRFAMLKVREGLQLRGDWIQSAEFLEDDARRFETEGALGFLPWLKLPRRRVRDKKLCLLLEALSVFDRDEAVRFLDRVLSQSPGDLDLRIQRIYLDLAHGEGESADREFRKLLSEPGTEREALLFHLWGLTELGLEKHKDALLHLETAYRLPESELVKKTELANDYAWALIVSEQYEQALSYLDFAIQTDPAPVAALLNKAYVCRLLNRPDEAQACDKKLLQLAPTDRRVFRNLMLERGS